MTDAQPIIRLAGRGDGVTADGRYVAGTAPGDFVRFDGETAVIEPGPHHQTPPCRHFPECGGCQLQQVDDAAYAAWVAERIVAALGGQGVAVEAVEPAHLSPPNSRRRASLRGHKRGGRLLLGFNAEASHRIVDMHECHILAPELFALVAPLRALLMRLVPEGQAASVSLTLSDNGIDLLLSNVEAQSLAATETLTAFAEAHGLARLSVEGSGGIDLVTERQPPLVHFNGVPVVLPPAPFLQATRDGEAALQRAVEAAVGDAKRVADLFCGLGTFALPLSARGPVHAADAAGPAVRALEAAARAAKRRLTIEHRDLFRRPFTPAELKPFDAVVLDPPRAGAREQAAQIARSNLSRVVAVSCNPNTLARDAAILVGAGFRAERLWPIGQFRWSTHVEAVVLFRR